MGVKRSIAIARMLDDVLPQDDELAREEDEQDLTAEDAESAEQDQN